MPYADFYLASGYDPVRTVATKDDRIISRDESFRSTQGPPRVPALGSGFEEHTKSRGLMNATSARGFAPRDLPLKLPAVENDRELLRKGSRWYCKVGALSARSARPPLRCRTLADTEADDRSSSAFPAATALPSSRP